MTQVRVEHLRRLALSVPDLGAAESFYRDVWKMVDAGQQGDFKAFRTAATNHADLVLRQGPSAFVYACFSVSTPEALETLANTVRASGTQVTPLQADELFPGESAGVQFQDPDGRTLQLVVAQPDEPIAPESIDPLAPRQLGHFVLWSPDRARAEAFMALLGFVVTDRTHLGMSFLRCNHDHHTMALVGGNNGKTGIQHIAFDVLTIDNVMRNHGRLRDMGQTCIWGVGRHGPGNNIFSYYQDPAGNFVEYFGEMEAQPEAFPDEAIFWGPEHKGDIWGVAGRPPAIFTQ